MKCHHLFKTLAAALIVLFWQSSLMAAPNEPFLLLSPVDSQGMVAQADQIQSQSQLSPHIARKGDILFHGLDLLSPGKLTDPQSAAAEDSSESNTLKGKSLRLALFSDKEVVVEVDNESTHPEGALNVSGRKTGDTYVTFSMTITEQNFVISFKDLSTGLSYRAVGNTQNGQGNVTELDISKRPPIIHSDPLVPPQ